MTVAGAREPTQSHPVRQMLRLGLPYWSSARKWRIRGASLSLFLLTVAQVGLSVWGNYWNRALFDAIERRSVRGVLLQAAIFALIFVVSISVTAAHLMVKRWLQLDWRAWLTDRMIGRWMEQGRHYRLLRMEGAHDNPDQRIAEDIRIATDSAIALAHTLVYSLLTLGTFIGILWNVSGTMTVPGTAIEVPGYLVPLAFLYAGLGTGLGRMLGRPLVRATNALQTAEADFRFGLTRMREHAEPIALTRGEAVERSGAASRFAQIVRQFDRQSLAYMGIVSFLTGYGGLLPVFPLLVAAPQYIMGAMTLGALMQSVQAFQQLASALSWPVDNVAGLAQCRASAERVLALHQDMQRLDEPARAPESAGIRLGRSDRNSLVIEDLCIADSAGQVLLEHFDAELKGGERVFLTGDAAIAGCVFKAVAGLWPWGGGRVLLPADAETLFIAQRPFLSEGTLRSALAYPRVPDAFSDDVMRHALELVGLEALATHLDAAADWEQKLTLQEQQRLAFARALLLAPGWLFLDGATSAFDTDGEQRMFALLRRELPRAAVLTIGAHPELERLHDRNIVVTRLAQTKYLVESRREAELTLH